MTREMLRETLAAPVLSGVDRLRLASSSGESAQTQGQREVSISDSNTLHFNRMNRILAY